MIRFEVRGGEETFREIGGVWRDLSGGSASGTPFQSVEWQETWWKFFGRRREPRFFLAWEGRDLVGCFSTVRSHGPWRTLRSLGVGPSDFLHPLLRNGYEGLGPELLGMALEQRDVDLVDLHQLRETDVIALKGQPLLQARCLEIALPARFEDYVAGLSKSLRADIRRGLRTVESGEMRVEEADPERLERQLEVFLDLHRRRWRARGLPGAFLGRLVAFQREWVAVALREQSLRLSLLYRGEVPIGAYMGLQKGSRAYYYQAGFDPEYGRFSPGTVLVAKAIREAIQSGVTHFDLMRGDEPYKRRWRPTQVRTNYRLLLPRTDGRGALASQLALVGHHLESRVRARLGEGDLRD